MITETFVKRQRRSLLCQLGCAVMATTTTSLHWTTWATAIVVRRRLSSRSRAARKWPPHQMPTGG